MTRFAHDDPAADDARYDGELEAADLAAFDAAREEADARWHAPPLSYPLDRTARLCRCDVRNAIFASLGLPPGECRPCLQRRIRGVDNREQPNRTERAA